MAQPNPIAAAIGAAIAAGVIVGGVIVVRSIWMKAFGKSLGARAATLLVIAAIFVACIGLVMVDQLQK